MSTSTVPAVTAGTYSIDPAASEIRFRATHAFGLGPVNGTFAVVGGTITIAADLVGSAVRAEVDPASFRTDKARRDLNVRRRPFLDAEGHPRMSFVSTRLRRDRDRWLLEGELTVRGRVAPVTLELVAGNAGAGGCRFQATTVIDRYAHGVGPRGVLGRYVQAELDIAGVAPVG